MYPKKIYLAGPLFTVAERTHNLTLEKELIALGYKVLLPQRLALNFVTPRGLDLTKMAADCARLASDPDNILVANIDGSECDSGTAVEYGLAIASTGRAIIYRTDVRTDFKKEVGVNAMFGLKGTKFIYMPCFADTEHETKKFYLKLASKIHRGIMEEE